MATQLKFTEFPERKTPFSGLFIMQNTIDEAILKEQGSFIGRDSDKESSLSHFTEIPTNVEIQKSQIIL